MHAAELPHADCEHVIIKYLDRSDLQQVDLLDA